jgi:hypothetical protein
MTSRLKILTVKEIAKDLQVSASFIYRNKHALGAFQACRGGRLLFLEDEIQRILRRKSNAISRKERQMERNQNDRRPEADEIVRNKNQSKKMGGDVQFRKIGRDENRHGIID